MLINFETIKYKNQIECKKAWLLGKRKYHWCLKKNYEPLWCKNGKFVSVCSGHKKDFFVYVPADDLKPGINYILQDTKNKTKIFIIEVNEFSFEYEVVN